MRRSGSHELSREIVRRGGDGGDEPQADRVMAEESELSQESAGQPINIYSYHSDFDCFLQI